MCVALGLYCVVLCCVELCFVCVCLSVCVQHRPAELALNDILIALIVCVRARVRVCVCI